MNIFKSLFHFSKIKPFLIIFLLLCLFVFVCTVSYVRAVSTDIANSVFRLHVIANSDTTQDQNLKLKVRDALLGFMKEHSSTCSSKEEVMMVAKSLEKDLKQVALDVIKQNGFDYDVDIQIGTSQFPTKQYGDIALPAGNYDSLKVKIGNASGQNWWCVMFPPLCFVDVSTGIVPDSSKQELKKNLNDEEYDLISETNSNEVNFKFKLIEFFQNWKLGVN